MGKRFVAIWFRHLRTDWMSRHRPTLREQPFVVAYPDHGRMLIREANAIAQAQGVDTGTLVADARAIIPSLQVLDDKPDLPGRLLKGLAEWCIRYTPAAAVDAPDGLILDVTGCAHLWGGERSYLADILTRLKKFGYDVHAAIADTVGTAWAIVRFGQHSRIIESGQQAAALLSLPSEALRLDADTVERLKKLGLRQVKDFIGMPRSVLNRRFGRYFIQRLNQALGYEKEFIQPVQPIVFYEERLPCPEAIVTRTGIEIGLQRLLDDLCRRLEKEQKGLRTALFKCYRVDGRIVTIEIGTHRPTHNRYHLFKLFEIKLDNIEPALGIELFILEAPTVEDVSPLQQQLWESGCGLEGRELSELLDRLGGKIGAHHIHRFIPDEHYWPERSIKQASSLQEELITPWKTDRPRPMQLLSIPERIEVTAPIPDYPPMLFRHRGKLHTIVKADGPERIEQEWWLQQGQHRDYYYVEDEEGHRYWLFRLGHYTADRTYQWFIHGFFS